MPRRRKDNKSSYLQEKASGPTVRSEGGNVSRADVFVMMAGVAVVLIVILLGNGTKDAGTNNILNQQQQQVPNNYNNNMTMTQPNPSPASTTTSSAPMLTATNAAKNNATDEPDASNMASRQAGNDQSGSPQEQVQLQEAHGQKFTIGENMVGERSTADMLHDEARKAKQNLVERNIGDQLDAQAVSIKRDVKEGAIADNLDTQLQSVKKSVKEGLAGVPFHAFVGDGPTDDPFDIFSEPMAEVQTRPNIDYSGYGHMKYVAGEAPQYDRKFYPRDGNVFLYQTGPLPDGMEHKVYSESNAGPHNYQQVVEQNRMIQQRRNKQGFNAAVMTPMETKWRNPNHDFFVKDEPHWFNRRRSNALANFEIINTNLDGSQREREVGNELGSTDHSWTNNNPKSGISGSNNPSAPNNQQGGGGGIGMMTNSTGQPGGAIGGDQWDKSDADWAQIKVKVRGSVKKILALFDRLFSEELFPDAVVDVQNNGIMFVRDGKEGKCILLARYYEYVGASIKATLGLGKTGPLTWAKNVDLSFDKIEKNKPALRQALVQDCAASGGYILSQDGTIKTNDGKKIQINVPWPKDQTILVAHPLRLGKGGG